MGREDKTSSSNASSGAGRKSGASQANNAKLEAFLKRHIHNSNYPQPIVDPLDFSDFPIDVLNSYCKKYNITVLDDNKQPVIVETESSFAEMLPNGSSFTERLLHTKTTGRLPKKEVADLVKRHFLATNSKENEVIANFIYCVNNEDKVFKYNF